MSGKEERKALLKARILEVAIQSFAEKGYHQTSLRYIADQLKYSPGTIYRHYDNKESLFVKAQIYGFRKLAGYLGNLGTENPFERLAELGEAYFRFSREWSYLYELMFLLTTKSQSGESQEHWSSALAAFTPLEEVAIQLWPTKIKDPFPSAEGLAVFLWSSIHGIVMLHANQNSRWMGLPSAEIQARRMIRQQVNLLQQHAS